MVLYVVRHAEALPVGGAIKRDAERPLSPRGKQDAALVARALARLDPSIGLILTSPLLRAVQTGELLRADLDGRAPVRVTENLAPGFRVKAFLEELSRAGSIPSVAAIGHQPDLGNLVAFLIAGAGHAALTIPACTVARILFDSSDLMGGAQLQWLVTPEVLRTFNP